MGGRGGLGGKACARLTYDRAIHPIAAMDRTHFVDHCHEVSSPSDPLPSCIYFLTPLNAFKNSIRSLTPYPVAPLGR